MKNSVPGRLSPLWVASATLIAVVVLLSMTGIFVLKSLARIPTTAAEQTREVLHAARDLVEAFREGTIEERFFSYATEISGSTDLQIAPIQRVEIFTREDRASIFWGAIPLPDVVVSATAPVQYTAYVDLDEPWRLRLEDQTLRVQAPPIRFNQPAIDASRIQFEIQEGSLLRDEGAALEDLKAGLTSLSLRQTRDLAPEVEETARQSIEKFTRAWLLSNFTDTDGIQIEVDFGAAEDLRPRLESTE